jgi:hypothetical protein
MRKPLPSPRVHHDHKALVLRDDVLEVRDLGARRDQEESRLRACRLVFAQRPSILAGSYVANSDNKDGALMEMS